MTEDKPIKAVAEIRRNADGEVHLYETDYYGEFIWSEGNFACDCNRSLFFLWAVGADEADDDDTPCSDDRFSVRIKDKTGTLLYQDGDWPV